MPDDDRKARRLGDETKHRIADLAAGWTVEDQPGAPDPSSRGDAPRRKPKTVPPPPPGSAARKALEDKIVEVAREAPDAQPVRATGKTPTIPPPVPRRAAREGDIVSVEQTRSDARGAKNDKSGSHSTNSTSGVIGGTPAPIFDRAAIAAQQKALAEKAATKSGAITPISEKSGGLFDRAGDRKSGPTPALLDDKRSGPTPAIIERKPDDKRSGPVPALAKASSPSLDDKRSGPTPAIVERSGALAKSGSSPTLGKPDDHRRSGPTPAIVERSGGIGSKAPAPAAGADRKSGPAPALGRSPLPPPRMPVGSTPRGPATSKSGSVPAIADKLPLRADATPAAPPPLPPPPVLGQPRSAPAVIIDDHALETIPELGPPAGMPAAKLAVPVGEFDTGGTVLEKEKLRIAYSQSTMKRDAANALLGLAEEETVVRAPPVEMLLEETADKVRRDTRSDFTGSSTSPFERGDPTIGERPDATVLSLPDDHNRSTVGTLRTTAALRRKRGIWGDVTYIATVVFGVRRARRELDQLEARQATRQTSRRHHLVTFGRTAITSDRFDHPALGPAREQLAEVEDQRSQHTAQVLSADTELMRCRTDRDTKAQRYKETIAALDTELASLLKKLDPLEKEAAAVKKKAAELRDSLRRLDNKIAATEASLVSVKGERLDKAAVQAEIVALRADRKAVAADEPQLAGELDALMPRIAGIEAARAEAQQKRADIEKSELEDQRRVEELLVAIGAKRKVVDRAAADAEVARDRILFELGERLYVDRTANLAAQLAPIDDIDVELGEADRRAMELKEIISSVDKAKMARGLAVIILLLAAVVSFVAWLAYML